MVNKLLNGKGHFVELLRRGLKVHADKEQGDGVRWREWVGV